MRVVEEGQLPPVTREDGRLAALTALLRLRGVQTDMQDLAHRCGGEVDDESLVRLAEGFGLSARWRTLPPRRLSGSLLPALVRLSDGRTVVLARVAADEVLLFDPLTGKPETSSREAFADSWTGRMLTLAPAEDKAGAPPAGEAFGLRWFVPALARRRGLLSQILAASLFIQLFGLATPLFSMVVIDKVLNSGNVSTLDVLVIGLVLLTAFDAALGLLRGYLFNHTTTRIDLELGSRLFSHLSSLPVAFFESRPVGRLTAHVKELDSVRAFLTGSGLTVLLDVAFTFVYLAVMLWFSAQLTLLVLGVLALLLGLHALVAPVLRKRLREKAACTADTQAFLVEAVTNVATVKAAAAEPRLRRSWEELLADASRAGQRAAMLNDATGQVSGALNKLLAVGVLWFGAHQVLEGAITAGTLIAFNMLAGRVSQPVLRLAQMWQQVEQAGISMQKLGEILKAQPEPATAPGRTRLGPIRGAVSFRNVGFRYAENAPAALEGLTFDIRPGEVVGLVGLSGSGKTTVAKLLQRLHVPQSGAVLVDGVDLAGADPGWLRRQLGVVPQDVLLFNRSVRDNIALADSTLPDERIIAAAELAGAHDFIVRLPEGYDTPVGERGACLSGGQRQRLALASALVHDPRILILDEATSHLDYESEMMIHANMRRICAGRTVIVIAHRLAALRDVDRILVLEDGRLIEDGTHEALVKAGRRYAALHSFQVGQLQAGAVRQPAE